MNFEMKIADIFHFKSGQTIFAGSIAAEAKLPRNSKVQLLIDNEEHQVIEIEGELMMDIRHPNNHRAISTSTSVDLTTDFVRQHECKLVEISV